MGQKNNTADENQLTLEIKQLYYSINEKQTLMKIKAGEHDLLLSFIIQKLDDILKMHEDYNNKTRKNYPELKMSPISKKKVEKLLKKEFDRLVIHVSQNKKPIVYIK